MKAKVKTELDKLKKLAERLEKNSYKKAIRAGAKILKDDLKDSAPELTGALKQSIGTKVDSAKGSTVAYGVVGPRSKFVKVIKGKKVQPSRYAAPLEKKRSFLLPAWNANKQKYLDKVKEVMATEMKGAING